MAERAPERRVVLVTGAARGIGASIAITLGSRGYDVAVNSRPGGTDPATTVGAVRATGAGASAFVADACDPAAAGRLVAEVEAVMGRLDALVLAATPPTESRPFADTGDAAVRAYLDAYVAAPFALVRAALPGMAARGWGRVVAIVSSAVSEVPPRKSAYVAAKSGMLGLCRALAVELAPSGVTVNAVSPGAVASADPDGATKARESLAARTYPMRRLASHADVAEAVAFLLSDAAAYVSGAEMALTGGLPL